VAGGAGEVEITASANGRNIVIGTNSGYANSIDYGATFTAGAEVTPFAGMTTRGDPSTAYGYTGSFYLSYLGNPGGGGGTGAGAFNGCNVPGREFMPWICVTGKHLFASWYDRRPSNGVTTDNSLTDFYFGRLDFEFGGPKVGANINMSANADSQCSSGWPAETRDITSATGCTIQPQTYGLCTNFTTNPPTVGGNCVPGAVPGSCGPISTCAAVNNGVP
jgi:hypothetical protein